MALAEKFLCDWANASDKKFEKCPLLLVNEPTRSEDQLNIKKKLNSDPAICSVLCGHSQSDVIISCAGISMILIEDYQTIRFYIK